MGAVARVRMVHAAVVVVVAGVVEASAGMRLFLTLAAALRGR